MKAAFDRAPPHIKWTPRFAIYGGRVASNDLTVEFPFDWKDLNPKTPAPISRSRTVGAKIEAREGGVYVPDVGYVDLVDVYSRGHVGSLLIECGSAEQFRAYQPLIETFLASLVVPSERDATSIPADGHNVDYVNDGFVWTGANGLDYVPELNPVGRGAGFPVVIPGIWQNDHQQFTLQLATDGSYAIAYAESAASGSVRIHESGRWEPAGPNLRLSPVRASQSSRNLMRTYQETTGVASGGPRLYAVTTLALEYRRNNLVYRTEGIELKGSAPPWYYTPSGSFSMVLRRTGPAAAK